MTRGQERVLWLLALVFFVGVMAIALAANEEEWRERCPASEVQANG